MMTKTKAVDESRQVGSLLGDYKLLKQLGQGSYGASFVAEHRFTKKQYVIKILPDELAGDRLFLERFENEIANLCTLDHPNIAKIYHVSFSTGVYFLVSECIVDKFGETTNLWQYFNSKERVFSEEALINLLEQIAKALDYLHACVTPSSKSLVHYGLKFNNILIGADEKANLRVVLSDTGLAKIIGIGASLTRSMKAVCDALSIGQPLFGKTPAQDRFPVPPIELQKSTPLLLSFLQNFAFLAPEQKRGVGPFDEKVDVWAFGILAYFLLMNEFPEGHFPLPSSRYKECRYDWDRVISECLKVNPQERPSSLMNLLQMASKEEKALDCTSVSEPITCEQASCPLPVASGQQFDLFGVSTTPKKENGFPFPLPERVVKEYHPEKKETKNIRPLLTDMVVIGEGYYFRGSNCGCRDEMPRHKVKVASFALDIHPVTNEQFVCFLDTIGEEKDSQNHDIIKLRDSRIKKTSGKCVIEPGYSKHPVVGVTWYGAVGYSQWVGKRLPTEAEWEIATCGGLENPMYPTGETIEKSEANFFSSDTTAVMSYPTNGYGLFDMPGNVYEWCQDWYEYAYYEASAQEPDYPKGPLQGVYRVLRGGCWKSLKEDLRCSKRHRNNPGSANGTYGFRCAADVMCQSNESSPNL